MIGWEKPEVVHGRGSRPSFDSNRDRHGDSGHGEIGEGFRAPLHHPRGDVPLIPVAPSFDGKGVPIAPASLNERSGGPRCYPRI